MAAGNTDKLKAVLRHSCTKACKVLMLIVEHMRLSIKLTYMYSDDSLIRAPIVPKSHLSGQKVWEPISKSGLMGDSAIQKTRKSEENIDWEQTCPDKRIITVLALVGNKSSCLLSCNIFTSHGPVCTAKCHESYEML